VAVRRLGADIRKVTEFFLCCRSGRGFMIDLRAPTDVSSDVAQPTLILATRNDGAVSFDHAEYLAATLHDSTLVELDTPTHLLWFRRWIGSHCHGDPVLHQVVSGTPETSGVLRQLVEKRLACSSLR
jgi:pimeloyl-ACP methyl ester carboxylesterase